MKRRYEGSILSSVALFGFAFCATWAYQASQPGPDSQAYFDTDGDPRNHYAGAEYIGRFGDVRRTECDIGDGAWPATVVGRVEFHVDGVWQSEADCAVECRVVLFDADGNGRLTLEDYAAFQRVFTGP